MTFPIDCLPHVMRNAAPNSSKCRFTVHNRDSRYKIVGLQNCDQNNATLAAAPEYDAR